MNDHIDHGEEFCPSCGASALHWEEILDPIGGQWYHVCLCCVDWNGFYGMAFPVDASSNWDGHRVKISRAMLQSTFQI